jgi:short-subunit dehydrogenase
MKGSHKNADRRIRKSKFEGKIIVITGASSGIGRQTAIELMDKGAKVIISLARSESKLEDLRNILEVRKGARDLEIVTYSCDVSVKEDVLNVGNSILERFGHVDLLINNAGFGEFGKVENQQIEQIENVMRTNYLGMVYCTKVFLGPMVARHSGHIVNVASLAASFGVAGMAGYCASKYAMLGFSESLNHELHGTGVRITVVSPIGVKTNFFNNPSFDEHRINYTGFMLNARTVTKAILAASNSSRFEIMVPFYMRVGVWLKHTIPFAINPITGALFRRQMRKPKRESS